MTNNPLDAKHANGQKPGTSHRQRILTGVAAIGVVALTVMAAILLSLQDLPVGIRAPSPVAQATPYFTPPPWPSETPTLPPMATPTSLPTVEPPPTLAPEMSATPTVPVIPPTVTPTMPPIAPVCTPPFGWTLYTVQPGDTLISLAYRYRINVSQLMQANCLANPVLYVGQVIFVPTVVVPPTPRPSCGPPPNWVWYTVQPGDTLYSLSVRTRTTVYAIVQANCLTSYTIYVGQGLWLPSLPPPPPPTATPPPTVTDTPIPTVTPGDTPTPTLSPAPSDTPSPTIVPGDTPTPTSTPTSQPPTAVPTPEPPTATPIPPPPTATPMPPPPTATPIPPPPPPTNTPVPFPTPSS